MKRINYLFPKIKDKENLRLAHKNARKGKTHYTEVKEVDAELDRYINEMSEMLDNMTYVPSEYTMFKKMDKGKEREIYKLPYFPDRIIHHAILQVLEPVWKKVLVNQTYQSIKGRGTQKCKRDLEKLLSIRDYENTWCLKVDVQKFYPSVNNAILKQIVRKKIKCKYTIWLLDSIINSMEGLPIGNYISQYLGNLYLAYMDHYMLSLKEVRGYSRYCDDIVIILDDKAASKLVLDILLKYVADNLKLKLKQDRQYFKLSCRGIDYVGFRFTVKGIYLRASIAKGFKKACRKEDGRSIASYYGWVKESNSTELWNQNYKGEARYAKFKKSNR